MKRSGRDLLALRTSNNGVGREFFPEAFAANAAARAVFDPAAFVLALVIPGALVILLAALLWTVDRQVMAERRFPPPLAADETEACYIVKDTATAQAIACI